MADIKRLIATSELKTDYLRNYKPGPQRPLYVNYEPVFDALLIQLVPPNVETVVHYIDEHVGLI